MLTVEKIHEIIESNLAEDRVTENVFSVSRQRVLALIYEIEATVRKEYEPVPTHTRVWAKFKDRDYVVQVAKYKHTAEILFAYGHGEEIDVKDLADEVRTGELDKIWYTQCKGRR